MPADRIVEGFWDCDACGAVGVGGLQDSCPSCGQRRPKDVEFYLTPHAKEITNPDQIAKALSGGDWRCKYCGYHNRAYRQECTGCGAVIEEDVERIPEGEFVPTENLMRDSSSEDHLDAPQGTQRSSRINQSSLIEHVSTSRPGLNSAQSEGRSRIPAWLGIVLAVLLIAGSGWGIYEAFIKTHDVPAHVSGLSWSREVEVEVYGTVREEGWSIPDGGREVSSYEKFHHNDKVLSHYETKTRQVPYSTSRQESYSCSKSNGNGTFTSSTCYRTVSETKYRSESYQEAVYKDVPVYETWYEYDIEKWHYDHTERVSGENQKPYWPEVQVSTTQREGQKSEKYIIYFTDEEGRKFKSETDFATWQSARVNQSATLQLNRQQSLRSFELARP